MDFTQTVNGHEITEPRYYYLGKYTFDATGLNGSPLAFLPPEVIGSVDLRTLPDQVYKNNSVSDGYAFFVTETEIPNHVFLGNKLEEVLPQETIDTWNTLLKINSTATSLVDLLWDTLTIFSDPTGKNAPMSLMPSGGELELFLGGHSRIKSKTFSTSLPEWTKIKEQKQLGYTKLRDENKKTGDKTYLQILSVWEKEFGVSYKEFIPAGLPDEKPEEPHTFLLDAFTDTNGTGIASHTPTGGGFSWVVDVSTGTPQIQSNKLSGGGVTGDSFSRAATSLSSADQFAQGVWSSQTSGSGPGWAVRKSASGTQTYYMALMSGGVTTYDKFYKCVAGTFTALGSEYGINKTLPNTYRMEVIGTRLNLYQASGDISSGTMTDSSIDGTTVGGLQTGIYLGYGTSGTVTCDDFVAGDYIPTTNLPVTSGLTGSWDFSTNYYIWESYKGSAPYKFSLVGDGDVIGYVTNTQRIADRTLQPTGSAKPLWDADGINGKGSANLDGVDDSLEGWNDSGAASTPVSTYVTASAYTTFVSFRVTGDCSDNANMWENDAIWCDSGGYIGLHCKTSGGVTTLYIYNYDSNADSVGIAISQNTDYVVMARHESGNIYISINNGSESSVASGNTGAVSSPLRVGIGTSAKYMPVRIGEIAIYNTALTGANFTSVMSYFMDKWQPAPPSGSTPTASFLYLMI